MTFLVASPQLCSTAKHPRSQCEFGYSHPLQWGNASLLPLPVPAPCQGWAWRCSYEARAAPRTCSSPPAWGAAHRAEGGGRGATAAAPEPGAAAQPTARAWPAAGVPPTWAPTGSLAGPCRVRLQPKVTQRRAELMLHPRPHSSVKTLLHSHSRPRPNAGPARPASVGLSYAVSLTSVWSCDPSGHPCPSELC